MDIDKLKIRAYDISILIRKLTAEVTEINKMVSEASNGHRESSVEPPEGKPDAKK